jgi:hypothetical protein
MPRRAAPVEPRVSGPGRVSAACLVAALTAAAAGAQDPGRIARDYAHAVEALNRAHAAKPVAIDERDLAKQLPAKAQKLPAELTKLPDAPAVRDALASAARAALELDRVEDFELLQGRLAALAPSLAEEVGIVESRQRFVAIGTHGVQREGLVAIADVLDLVLDAYRDVFGLESFSKIPGKKLRLRVQLVPRITRPPHFAPQFPFHSEIDFPVVDARAFRSPTKEGQFLFYGLCHELGHVLAMWGDRQNEEDRHAWAHYTGVVLVEHLAAKKLAPLQDVRDVRWRSLEFERKQLAAKRVVPGPKDADTVFARLLALHDAVGPRTIGEALAALDAAGKHQRINRVRYYAMRDFHAALLATAAGRAAKHAVDAAFAAR